MFSTIGLFSYAQYTNVFVNNGQSQSAIPNNAYYINGISSKEDIGGVTAYIEQTGIPSYGTVREKVVVGKAYQGDSIECYCVFRNDNPFPVTVVFQGKSGDVIRFSSSITLQTNETKKYEIDIDKYASQILTITRRLGQTKDPVTELKRYKELLDAGIITQEEFEAKKKEILSR